MKVDSTSEAPKPAADVLRQKEAFNFALFQHNPLAITVVDRAGCVVKSNLARRTAPDPLPPLGKPLFDPGDAELAELQTALSAAVEDGRVRECTDVRLGERIFVFTIAPFPHGAIVIRRDVTEHRQAQAQLVQAQKLAALGTLVSGVAHEVSNPNNIIMLSATTLRKHIDALLPVLDERRSEHGNFDVGMRTYDDMREELVELAASCLRGAERIDQLVADLKGYARQDNGTVELIDINAVVKGALSLMGATVRKATRRFEVTYAPALPPVRGVARRIEQVVINLVGNACQALPDPDRALSVSTAHDAGGGCVLITVRDEGKGIDPRDFSRITDPFFTTRHDAGGTGLGLSISLQIVENHHGKLTFDSEPGRGTTVTVALPEGD